LKKIAKDNTLYTQARASGNWSLPSHIGMFTGLSSAQHRITNNGTTLKQGNTIFDKLSNEYNYNTGVFSSNGFLVKKDVGLRDCLKQLYLGLKKI